MTPHGARIIADVPCIHCRYNLRGRTSAPENTCSECGALINDSLQPHLLHFADFAWRRMLIRGVVWMILATAAAVIIHGSALVGFGWFRASMPLAGGTVREVIHLLLLVGAAGQVFLLMRAPLRTKPARNLLAVSVLIVALVVVNYPGRWLFLATWTAQSWAMALGAWIFAAPEAGPAPEPRLSERRILRGLWLVFALIAPAGWWPGSQAAGPVMQLLRCTPSLLMIAATILLYRRFAAIAGRLPQPRLAFQAWGVCAANVIAFSALTSGELAGGIAGLLLDLPEGWQLPALFTDIDGVGYAVFVVASIWELGVLIWLYRLIRQTLVVQVSRDAALSLS